MPRHADEDEDFSDEIKPEDGSFRYWMFLNGEQVRLFSALIALIFGVLWGFLYVLGAGRSLVTKALIVCGGISFLVCLVFDDQIRRYQENGWRKGKQPSPKRQKIEVWLAIVLWLFIFISVGVTILVLWIRGRP